MSNNKYILKKLPYTNPFLFVDSILEISEKGCTGEYTFKEEAFYYQGHFKNHTVTPGVILTECMAQIGLVALGIYILELDASNDYENYQVALTTTEMEFLHPVYPNETVTVVSTKEYFRFSKLKCKVKMFSSDKKLVCKGIITGMLVSK